MTPGEAVERITAAIAAAAGPTADPDLPPIARLRPDPVWPYGYAMEAAGLTHRAKPDAAPEWLADPFDLHAEVRTEDGTGWSLALSFRDGDGRLQVVVVPMGDLAAGEAGEIRRELASKGLRMSVTRGGRERFTAALAGVRVALRAILVSKSGWHAGNEVFAAPSFTAAVPARQREPVVFRSEQQSAHFRIAGDLSGWRTEVAALAEGQGRLLFALGLAFAGPLLDLLGLEGGAFNLVGPSSCGKTTALRLAGSVWGGGGPLGFAVTWRTTANALEGVAAAHNDALLCLDELELCEPRDLEAAAYVLTNGSGKGRSRADGEARARARWRVCCLSTGEVSLAQRIGEGGPGRQARGGQAARFVDLPADAGRGLGLFDHVGGFADAGALADAVRERTVAHHGTAGPAFVELLLARRAEATRVARDAIAAFVADRVPAGATGQVVRVAQRFALAAAAGELAVAFKILPFAPGAVTGAADGLLRAWIGRRGGVGASEARDAVAAVRGFLEQHGSARFVPARRGIDESTWRAQRIAGFRLPGDTPAEDGDFLFHGSGWAEAVAGLFDRAASLHRAAGHRSA